MVCPYPLMRMGISFFLYAHLHSVNPEAIAQIWPIGEIGYIKNGIFLSFKRLIVNLSI